MDNPIITGGLINAALFLGGVILAGALGGNHIAVVLALASAGVAAISYGFQMMDRWGLVALLFAVSSWLLAAAGGWYLVQGYLI